MTTRICLLLSCLALACTASLAQTQNPPAPTPAPDAAGEWTGVWSSYNPAQGGSTPKDLCKNLTAKVQLKEGQKDGVWEASFEGDCGRPYKYAIKMEGRQVGKVVLFKGTTDLGKQDGGVYDWIGRANDKEFVGFFTSAFYTGTFNLARAKKEPAQ